MSALARLYSLVTAALLLAPAFARAQLPEDRDPVTISTGGTELFRGLLDHAGIKPITQAELISLNRFDDVILISFGTTATRDARGVGPLTHITPASGRGSALIATDTLTTLKSSADRDFFVAGDQVRCLNSGSTHSDKDYCPYVVPVGGDFPNETQSLFRGLNRIATNRPSYLVTNGLGGDIQHVLARLPGDCVGPQGEALSAAPFALGGQGPDASNPRTYRLLVIADHSIFINQMLLEPNSDNLKLAYRVIDYLQGPEKNRKRCIFYENGVLKERFDDLRQAHARQNPMPLPQVNLWAMQDKLTDLGNAIIDRLQTNDAHNKILLGSGAGSQSKSLEVIARFFLILATVVACFFLLRRLWSSRKPSDIPPPPSVASATSGPPGIFDRRQKELLRRDNVFEPVRDLIREFFESIGAHGDGMPRLPKLVISDVVRKPESLRTAIRDFWKIAFGPPQTLSVNRWRELAPFFDRVRQAHADGKWRFVNEEATVRSMA
jgi:hypothetical protein